MSTVVMVLLGILLTFGTIGCMIVYTFVSQELALWLIYAAVGLLALLGVYFRFRRG